jgi:hypothetical protein
VLTMKPNQKHFKSFRDIPIPIQVAAFKAVSVFNNIKNRKRRVMLNYLF